MGIKEAYDKIKDQYMSYVKGEGNFNRCVFPIRRELEQSLKIIEEECPEVLEKNSVKCKECNKYFIPHHPSQKFCCKKCRESYWNKKRQERYQNYIENEFEEASVLEDLQEW